MNTREIKTKRPWKRVLPQGYMQHGIFKFGDDFTPPVENLQYAIVTQADFLKEYYPSGHAINDEHYYPDIYRSTAEPIYDADGNDTGRSKTVTYKECVPRYAFAFQQIITTKQLVHLCGNDIQFELNVAEPTQEQQDDFKVFREGWLGKDMEVAFYEAAKAVKITGDGAVVGYLHDGKFGFKALSYLNGDLLYPHYDSITGKMILFARSYSDYDNEGEMMTEWLEVWDKTTLKRFKRSGDKYKSFKEKILNLFNIDGYELVSNEIHGFPFVPVAYKRSEDGACWFASQDSIDAYELSFSQMAHNNQAFGEPILYLQGENVEMVHDINGTLKTLTLGTEDKAGYLESQSASDSYMKQLETLYKMIYEQSFAVIPPELRSGDLPAAALKILYSPAYEKAICDAAEYQTFLNDLVEIFSYGFGVEMEKTIDFSNLPIKWWIRPYIHVNESAIVSDLAMAVQNGFISKETATERIAFYGTVGEWDRIMKEYKQQQEADLLYEEDLLKAQAATKHVTNNDTTQAK